MHEKKFHKNYHFKCSNSNLNRFPHRIEILQKKNWNSVKRQKHSNIHYPGKLSSQAGAPVKNQSVSLFEVSRLMSASRANLNKAPSSMLPQFIYAWTFDKRKSGLFSSVRKTMSGFPIEQVVRESVDSPRLVGG